MSVLVISFMINVWLFIVMIFVNILVVTVLYDILGESGNYCPNKYKGIKTK
ncbi:hypothetical protein LCGC14_1983550 [marine sediment metagenome]|uniref:Uncharacterized protein n=1 Tax=marine sediment metagenome TaxID=412755 RepID=A0A0F9F838_9ZZZZ